MLPDPKDQRLAELENQLAQAHANNSALQEQLRQLKAEVETLKRSSKRQATPFSRQKKSKKPKPPGRKAGQGKFTHREKPTPEEVDDTKEVPMSCCPECGGDLTDMKEHEHYEVDIPPVKPVVTRYVTQGGHCRKCKKRVRSRHPDQISTATGAAGVSVGPRAKALGADLKDRLGVSYEKAGDLLWTAFGLSVTRSGLCQADGRLAKKARPCTKSWQLRCRSALPCIPTRQAGGLAHYNPVYEYLQEIRSRFFTQALIEHFQPGHEQ